MGMTAIAGSSICGAALTNNDKYHNACFWHKEGDSIICDLCPHGCILSESKTGICRSRQNINGKLVSLGYGKPCAVHSDPIEKKPLYHMLPGTRTYSIGVAGCNLCCKNCQNHSISQVSPLQTQNYHFSPQQIVDDAKRNGCLSISYTYSEPVVWIEYVMDTAKLARKAGLKNVLVSSGYINTEPLKELCTIIDGAHIDLKSFDNTVYRNLNAGKLEPVLQSLKLAKEKGVWVEVVNLVIPQWSDDLGMIRSMCKWISKNLGNDTPLHFSRFFPLYKLENLFPTPLVTLESAKKIALEEKLNFVYIGNVAEFDSNTYCPSCGELLIYRKGYRIKPEALNGGVCEKCKYVVPGIWNF